MFSSWKSRAAVFAVAATMAVPVLGLASPAGAAKGGNSDAAHTCQKGGWQSLYRSDGTPFANQDACVSYGAQGGTPQTTSALQVTCAGPGGTFGLTNLTGVAFTFVAWTCNGVEATTDADIPQLLAACQPPFTVVQRQTDVTHRDLTCGTPAT